MDPDDPPNFSRNYPLGGERIGPAWRAAWRVLASSPRRWHTAGALAERMTAEQIEDRTARTLLAAARSADVIEVRYRVTGTPRRRRAEYRTAP
jgi:hypothetical protein